MTKVVSYSLDHDQVVEFRYYGTRVFSSISDRQKFNTNKNLGRLIIFLGSCLVIISSVDLSKLLWTLTPTEQSIGPCSGKDIGIGLFIMAVGIFTLIAVEKQSHSTFNILLLYALVGIIVCFFGLSTSIAVLQRYTKYSNLSDKDNRNKEQAIQFALSGLLIGIFSLTFLLLSCLSCMICWTMACFYSKHKWSNSQRFSPSPKQGLLQCFPL